MTSERSILFFADGSQETSTKLKGLLRSQVHGSLLSSFLGRSRTALQAEASQLPQTERRGLPNFNNLEDIICYEDGIPNESLRHPALHPVEILIVQLGHFIAAYESRPEIRYPDPEVDIVVGVCFGELAAAALTACTSLLQLVSVGSEAVRVAFRAGMLASRTGEGLEPCSSPRRSWSMTVSRTALTSDAMEINRLADQMGLPKHRRPYITAISRSTVTLGGPPTSLAKFLDHLGSCDKDSVRLQKPVQIYAPYHSSSCFSKADIHSVVAVEAFNSISDGSSPCAYRRTFISAATGTFYSSESFLALLQETALSIMAKPIMWEKVVEGCISHLQALPQVEWLVRPFGQTALAKSLASSISHVIPKASIRIDEAFGSDAAIARARQSPIAIVGMAGRFPRANSTEALWDLLQAGVDCHQEIPKDRFDSTSHLSMPAYGCFIDQPGMFDARFFNMSPREALQTDPGQRLALVTAHEALEMSGFVPNRTPSTMLDRVGSFNGQVADEYKEQNAAQHVDTYFITGTMRAFATGRINHHFKFGGPAVNIDTACSTSSVALQMACNSIWDGECDTAVVGGMNILSSSDNYLGLKAGHFISPTGGCKTWDKDADGYCRGEAVASVVIKPLSAAEADNDTVLGVILSTSSNYSAAADSITRPHGRTQEALYVKTLQDAGIQPSDIDYVEMHGTGTQAGDVVEMGSVCNVFAPASRPRPDQNPLYVGTIKANTGHAESASGVASLVKSLLIFQHNTLPPHIGIKNSLNPKLPNLSERNIQIPVEATALPERHGKRRILINNFSAAGGNTACVLEEPPKTSVATDRDPRSSHVVCVSAKSAFSLHENVTNLTAHLEQNPNIRLSDLSYSTTARRSHHPFRQAFVASSLSRLVRQMRSFTTEKSPMSKRNSSPKTVFCFTGQGSFYNPLAQELYMSNKHFHNSIMEFEMIAQAQGFPSLVSPIMDGGLSSSKELSQAQIHLSLVAVQMALHRLFRSLGIVPMLTIGHSLGEYAAMYAAGVMSASDTLYLVGQRANLLEQECLKDTHGMFSVQADPTTMRSFLNQHGYELDICCINGPQSIVLGGDLKVCRQAIDLLTEQGLKCCPLDVPFAYHSPQMDQIMPSFESVVSSIDFQRPSTMVASPSTVSIFRGSEEINTKHLLNHARNCVNFHQTLLECSRSGVVDDETIWLEIGSRPLLSEMIKSTLGRQQIVCASLEQRERPWTTLSGTLRDLYNLGLTIDWQEYHREYETRLKLIHLPAYAWENKAYWIPYDNDWLLDKGRRSTPRLEALSGPNTTTVQRLMSEVMHEGRVELEFETDLASEEMHRIVAGHSINGQGLCPASVYADIALTVANHVRTKYQIRDGCDAVNVSKMNILRPIVLPKIRPGQPQLLFISAVLDLEACVVNLAFSSKATSGVKPKELNAECLLAFTDQGAWIKDWPRSSWLVYDRVESLIASVDTRSGTDRLSKRLAYKLFSGLVEYGPEFQGMHEVFLNDSRLEAVAKIQLAESPPRQRFHCSPYWIDSFVHLSGLVLNTSSLTESGQVVFISHGWETLEFIENALKPSAEFCVHVRMQQVSENSKTYIGDCSIFEGDSSKMVGLVKGIKFQKFQRSLLDALIPPVHKHDQASSARAQSGTQSDGQMRQPLGAATGLLDRATAKVGSVPSKQGQAHSRSPWMRALHIIAEETRIPLDDLDLETNVQDMGIDSLLGLNILSRMRDQIPIELPPDVFDNYTTLSKLRNFFAKDDITSGSSTSSVSSNFMTPASVTTPSPTEDLAFKRPKEPYSRSDSDVQVFRNIIATEIGIEVSELMASDDIASFGIDSLMLLSISGTVRERLDISFPLDSLQPGLCMTDLETSVGLSQSRSDQSRPVQKMASIVSDARPQLSILLQGSIKHADKIAFLFPDGSGSATSYTKLACATSNICLIGLNSPYLLDEASFTISDLIETWIPEIRRRQPSGPYIFAGWSAGGYYAFEATKRLLSEGETVSKLIAIDTPPRNVYGAITGETLNFLSTRNIMTDDQEKTTPEWVIKHFRQTLHAIEDYRPEPLEQGNRSLMPEFFAIWARDGVLDGRTAETDSEGNSNLCDPVAKFLLQPRTDTTLGDGGWCNLAPMSSVWSARTGGNHFTMVRSSNVPELSTLLQAAMVGDSPARLYGSLQ